MLLMLVSSRLHNFLLCVFLALEILLSLETKNILCKRLNFVIPQRNIKYSDYLLPFDLLSRDVNSLNFSSFDKERVNSRLRLCTYSSLKQVSKISEKNLPDEDIKALKNFIENEDLVIQKAAKDNTIVILNKNDCISRLTCILDDTSKFKGPC